jgi:hypothetical protein
MSQSHLVFGRAIPAALSSLFAASLVLASCARSNSESGSAGESGAPERGGSDASGGGGKAEGGTGGGAGVFGRAGSTAGGSAGTTASAGGTDATGASGGSAGTGGSGGVDHHPAELLNAAICETVRACCETAGFFDGVVEQCAEQLAGSADEYRASVSQGRLSIDEDALASCGAHIRMAYLGCGWSLSEAFAAFSDCVDGIVGAVPIGQACTFDEECVGGGNGHVQCLYASCFDVPIGAEGDRCVETTGPRVTVLVPSSAIASGGAECRRADGLYCREVSATEYHCAPVIPDGEPCESDDQCVGTSYCADTCQPAKPEGSSCTSTAQCGGLYCSKDSQTCTNLPDQADCQG